MASDLGFGGGGSTRGMDRARGFGTRATTEHALVEQLDAILHLLRCRVQGVRRAGSGRAPGCGSRGRLPDLSLSLRRGSRTHRRGVGEDLLHHRLLLRGGELGHVHALRLRHRDHVFGDARRARRCVGPLPAHPANVVVVPRVSCSRRVCGTRSNAQFAAGECRPAEAHRAAPRRRSCRLRARASRAAARRRRRRRRRRARALDPARARRAPLVVQTTFRGRGRSSAAARGPLATIPARSDAASARAPRVRAAI